MKQLIIFFITALMFTACGDDKNSSHKLQDLYDNGETYVDTSVTFSVQDLEPDTANFTEKDWKNFEDALTDEFGENIYPTFLAYEKALDSCGLLDTATSEGYLRLLDKLSNENDLTLLTSCNNLLDDKTQDNLMLLVSAFSNTLNSNSRKPIPFALQLRFSLITRDKKTTAQSIVKETINTLGKHSFDKKICQTTALLNIMNMVM